MISQIKFIIHLIKKKKQMKKLSKLLAIVALVLISLNIMSQEVVSFNSSELNKNPYLKIDNGLNVNTSNIVKEKEPLSKGDLTINFNYSTDRLATYGCETDGEYFYVACHHPEYCPGSVYRYDNAGNFVDSTVISYTGTTAMAYDGEYFYTTGSVSNVFNDREIYIWDFTNNFTNPDEILVDIITYELDETLCWSLTGANFATYSPDDDAFWLGYWTNTMILVDREGNILDTFEGTALGEHNLTGCSYDNLTSGGPYIWAADVDNQLIRQYHLPSKTYTGNSYSYTPEITTSGEMFLSSDLVAGKRILGLYGQGGDIVGYDLDASINVVSYDIAVNNTVMDLYYPESEQIEIVTNITNNGLEPLTSFDYSYQVDDGNVSTMSVTTILNSFESLDFTHDIEWIPEEGVHELKIWTSNPEGYEDENHDNDTIVETKYIYANGAKKRRVVLHEEFTSSTCGPCVSASEHLQELFGNNNPEDFTFVAYQMNWPGTGDIYYDAAGGGVRRTYYEVSGIPHMNVDGGVKYPTEYFQTDFNERLADSTFLTIESTWLLEDEDITVSVTLNPYFSYPENHRMYITVIEKQTEGNAGTNGMTEFHNVEMKMIGGGSGIVLPEMESGTPLTYEYTENLSNTNIEEWNDLSVIVWVQNYETYEVLQSGTSDLTTDVKEIGQINEISIYPNPTSDILNIQSDVEIQEVYIYNCSGQLVMEKIQRGNLININTSDFEVGIYFVKTFTTNSVITKKLVIE